MPGILVVLNCRSYCQEQRGTVLFSIIYSTERNSLVQHYLFNKEEPSCSALSIQQRGTVLFSIIYSTENRFVQHYLFNREEPSCSALSIQHGTLLYSLFSTIYST